jgi:hypothetical protein
MSNKKSNTPTSTQRPLSKILITSLVLALVATAIGVATFMLNKQRNTNLTESAQVGAVVEFEGVLTSFKNDCIFDGVCSGLIDGKYTVVISPGMVATQVPGGVSEINDDHVGKRVSVKAQKTGNNEFTISGSKDYYIKLIK